VSRQRQTEKGLHRAVEGPASQLTMTVSGREAIATTGSIARNRWPSGVGE
jgi:hypothetical protein